MRVLPGRSHFSLLRRLRRDRLQRYGLRLGLQLRRGQLPGSQFLGLPGIFFLDLGEGLDQIVSAPRGHVHEADPGQMSAVCPLGQAAEAKGQPANPETELDTHPGSGAKALFHAHTATVQAEIDDAAGERGAVLHQQQVGLFVHIVAGIGPTILFSGHRLFRHFCRFHRFCRFHCALHLHSRKNQCPPAASHGRWGADGPVSRPFRRSYIYRLLMVPSDSL